MKTSNEDTLNFPLKLPFAFGVVIIIITVFIFFYVDVQKRKNQLSKIKKDYCSIIVSNKDLSLLNEITSENKLKEKEVQSSVKSLKLSLNLSGSLYIVFKQKNDLWSATSWVGLMKNGKYLLKDNWGDWDGITSKKICEGYRIEQSFWFVKPIQINNKNKAILLLETEISD